MKSLKKIIIPTLTLLSVESYASTTQNAATSSKDGIIIKSYFDINASGEEQLKCELINTNSFPIPIEYTTDSCGFEFYLLDSFGREITPDESWQYPISNIAERGVGRHLASEVNVGATIKYTFPLRKVFKNKLNNGIKLIIEWVPGYDGRGNILKSGRGLKIEVPLPSHSKSTSPSTPSPTKETLSENSNQTRSSQAKPLPWLLIGGIAAATIGASWWLIRRRKR